jgi:hypothetical protein
LAIKRSTVAINSSGTETVVYAFVMNMLYITYRLFFLSDVYAMCHNYYIYGRDM